jgi:translocation and assembly module TamB
MIDTPNHKLQKLSNRNLPDHPIKTKSESRILPWLIYGMLLALGGSLSYSWYLLTQKLSPLVETRLSKFLNRPVELGAVEAISWNQVRFSKSHIPSTTTDPDYASLDGINVNFNPIKLILNQKLQLDLTLIRPFVYLEEDDSQTWIDTKINRGISQWNGISIELQTIAIQDSSVTLRAKSPEGNFLPHINLKVNQSNVSFSPQLIDFDLQGNFLKGGELNLAGSYKLPQHKLNLLINSQEVSARDIDYLLAFPFQLESGTINSNLRVNLNEGKLENINGFADLKQVDLQVPKLPQPLRQTQGKVIFEDTFLKFNQISTNFGFFSTDVSGLISTTGNLDLRATSQPLSIDKAIATLNLPQPSLDVQGDIQADLTLKGTFQKPELTGKVISTNKSKLDDIDLDQAQANFALINSNLTIKDFNLTPSWGGSITGKGDISLKKQKPEFFLTLKADNIPVKEINDIYQLNSLLTRGKIDGEYNLFGSWKNSNSLTITGTTQLQLAEGKATLSNFNYNQNHWQGNLNLDNLNLTRFSNLDCSKLKCENSLLNGDLNVYGSKSPIQSSIINVEGSAKFNYLGGEVNVKNLEIKEGVWESLVETKDLQLEQISQLYSQPLPTLTGKIDSNLKLKGNLDSQSPIITTGEGELTLPQGKIYVSNLSLEAGQFSTEIIPQSLAISSFHPQLKGTTTGKFKLNGDIEKLTWDQLKIQGNLNFSEGISFVNQPLTTDFKWDGKQLVINQANTQGIRGKGVINVNLLTKQIEDFNLDIKTTDNIELKSLSLPLPSQFESISYQGTLNFDGKVFGSLTQPNLEGNLALDNFAVTDFQFNSLVGKIRANLTDGIKLNLSESGGKGDFIDLSLDSNYQPISLDLQLAQIRAQGLRENQIFKINSDNIPLAKLAKSFPSFIPLNIENIGDIKGEMAANLELNLENNDFIVPTLIINDFKFNNFKGDKITASLESTQGKISLNNGYLENEKSKVFFKGNLINDVNNPQFKAEVEVEQGNIQEIFKTWELFEWSDFNRGLNPPEYGKASDLYENKIENTIESTVSQALVSVGNIDIPILDQLADFQEIEQKAHKIQQEKLTSSIPKLRDLNGNFKGIISLSGSLKKGIETEFNFQGNNWDWGRYQANLVQVKGSYKDDLLTLLPIKIKQEDSLFSLSGTFTKERISGQIRIEKLPLKEIQKVVSVPKAIDLAGKLSANIAISGSEESPLAKGEITLHDSSINETPIDSTYGTFSYKNSRINFFATSNFNNKAEPLIVKGSFPYQLFSNSISPDTDQFNVSLNVKDDGFSLLDIISNNNINWLEGNGEINLDIVGNYNQTQSQIYNLQTEGIINLENTVIAADLLPNKPLTDINGKILFDFDQIKFDNLTGKFSGGDLKINGNLPLLEINSQLDPLTINANNLAMNLNKLYHGNVQGTLKITGSAIAPKLGGNIKLYEGKILLPESSLNNAQAKENAISLNSPQIENLNLELGPNINITKQPILNLTAMGDLKVSGTINQPKLDGNISLQRGNINLFTSQLKLAEDHNNIVKFSSNNGLDPYLDIELVASVTETNRHQFVTNPVENEIEDLSKSTANTLETIRVKANVNGLSSQIANSLKLTSSPQRSETEIIALLGGGFIDNFAKGDNNNFGLAKLASSAFLGSFQGELGEALGFSEFRLFPTQIVDPNQRTSTLGLGAELGIDIGSKFSVSFLKILTNQEAPQYSVRYRINEQTVLRGSTDFQNNTLGTVEFEHRF